MIEVLTVFPKASHPFSASMKSKLSRGGGGGGSGVPVPGTVVRPLNVDFASSFSNAARSVAAGEAAGWPLQHAIVTSRLMAVADTAMRGIIAL